MKKKIVYDEKIPYVDKILGNRYELRPMPAWEIDREAVSDADGLIIRTRTKIDRDLLYGSKCKVVATATIGTDHIDCEWCKGNDIQVANAPGCNAPGVAQWVFASIATAMPHLTDPNSNEKPVLGVVGVGHVGSIVVKWGKSMGFKVLQCDPPRARQESDSLFCTLNEIAEKADIITFHTPLTKEGADATFHLADKKFFDSLRRKPYILNAARGPITDTIALLDALSTEKISGAMIDCWENEPEIDKKLLDLAIVATPHIAGYSLEGKIRATAMAAKIIEDALNPEHTDLPDMSHIARDQEGQWIKVSENTPATLSLKKIFDSYDISADTKTLKSNPEDFENLRNNYNLRHEVK